MTTLLLKGFPLTWIDGSQKSDKLFFFNNEDKFYCVFNTDKFTEYTT